MPGGTTGEFRDDSQHVGQWYTDCEVVSDNECMDHCVTQQLGWTAEAQYGETPDYGIWWGQMDCQEWASDVLSRCQRRCLAERLLEWLSEP